MRHTCTHTDTYRTGHTVVCEVREVQPSTVTQEIRAFLDFPFCYGLLKGRIPRFICIRSPDLPNTQGKNVRVGAYRFHAQVERPKRNILTEEPLRGVPSRTVVGKGQSSPTQLTGPTTKDFPTRP